MRVKLNIQFEGAQTRERAFRAAIVSNDRCRNN